LDEVESARVTLYVPENRLLIDNKKQATAAVLIHLKGTAQLRPESVKTIRFLVASAVEGLQANQVTVADNHGSVFSEPSDNDSMIGLASGQLASRQNLEQYLSRKAEGMLEKVLGPGQAVVRVSAETDYDTESTTKEEFSEGVLKSKKFKKDVSNSTSASPLNAGVPGITTNTGVGAGTNNVTGTPATITRTERRQDRGATIRKRPAICLAPGVEARPPPSSSQLKWKAPVPIAVRAHPRKWKN
jgi:flagellar M-ring protein FliF